MEHMQQQNEHGTVGGTIGGTLVVFVLQLHSEDLTKTCILAAIGAVVSFLVSLGLKWLLRWVSVWRRRRDG